MNLPDGIDEATWAKALKNYGYPWREGQRCDGSTSDFAIPKCPACGVAQAKNESIVIGKLALYHTEPHDIPMPSPTKELLWDMVVKLASLRDELDGPYFIATSYDPAEDVIRAWASMGAT